MGLAIGIPITIHGNYAYMKIAPPQAIRDEAIIVRTVRFR
jgi:hypothetical protein